MVEIEYSIYLIVPLGVGRVDTPIISEVECLEELWVEEGKGEFSIPLRRVAVYATEFGISPLDFAADSAWAADYQIVVVALLGAVKALWEYVFNLMVAVARMFLPFLGGDSPLAVGADVSLLPV